jgi:hypothetical protein
MSVKDGRLVLPDGRSYRMLVLPNVGTMTPRLLGKIKELVAAGATVVGGPPSKSPGLSDYPKCDDQVKKLAAQLWGTGQPPAEPVARPFGKGKIVWGGPFGPSLEPPPPAITQFSAARWIWRAEGNPAVSAPPGTRYFRRVLNIEAGSAIASARLAMTADNTFQCWVNGQSVGTGDDWKQIYSMDLTRLIKPGANLLAVAVRSAARVPRALPVFAAAGPAGGGYSLSHARRRARCFPSASLGAGGKQNHAGSQRLQFRRD